MSNLDQTNFRQVLSQFASGVAVLTTKYGDSCHGITVSSFCSLSLDPQLVLVCINQDSYCLDLIKQSECFGINILDELSEGLSRHFASRISSKFTGIAYRLGQSGVPLLENALATIECRLANHFPGGDHSILVGEVITASVDHYSQPLLYFRREYKRIATDDLIYAGGDAASTEIATGFYTR